MHNANIANFTVINTPKNAPKPALKVVESEKAVRLRKNLEIIEQVLDGSFDHELVKNYSGMGGLYAEIKERESELVHRFGKDCYLKLIDSATSGYYTPSKVVGYVYDIVRALGFNGGHILEPSCGTGVFLEHMPEGIKQNSTVTAIEKEPISYAMAKAAHPDVGVVNMGFENYQQGGFDLIVGNPPYGSKCVYDAKHIDLKDQAIHHYFVAKCARLLNDDGLLAMVVPCYVLDNWKNHARNEMAEHVELVTAYRLPDTLFTGARVTVDIAVFRKVKNPRKDWIEAKTIELANKKRFFMSSYFVENPDHIIGRLDSYSMYLHTKKRERTGLKCVGTMRDVVERLPLIIDKLTAQKKTKSHSQENAKKADSQNLQIFKSEKSKNMESAKSLLQEISKILKMLEAKLA